MMRNEANTPGSFNGVRGELAFNFPLQIPT